MHATPDLVKDIYLIRHGETEYNRKRVVQGSGIDADLNELGQEEWAKLHYAGLSRARLLLIPMVPKSSEKRYKELVTAFGRRLSKQ